MTTLAGSSQGFADGKGSLAQFYRPSGLTVDNNGNVFVADLFNLRIRKIDPDGTVSTIAGTGAPGYVNGPANIARFSSPHDVAVDKAGNLYVTESGYGAIRMLKPGAGGYTVSTLAGPTTAVTPGYVDGVGTNARFFFPFGLSIDTIGNLYVAEVGNNLIRKIVVQSASVTTMAGAAAAGYRDGPSGTALFYQPYNLAADRGGKYVIIADLGNYNIRKAEYLSDGSVAVSTLAGSRTGALGYQDGDFINARFNNPFSIAWDAPLGAYVIADHDNDRIRVIDIATSKVRTLAGTGGQGAADGSVANATFYQPSDLAVDAAGNIYIADEGNNRIRKIAYE